VLVHIQAVILSKSICSFPVCNNFPPNIWFYKIFGFPLEAILSRFLIIHIQFKDVSNQRKSEA